MSQDGTKVNPEKTNMDRPSGEGGAIRQKYLGKAGLVVLITVLGMAPPLSTDMYMPSLPQMAEYFGAPTWVVNMTMISFFIAMALGMLLLGPLSDRYGRKPVLLVALALYTSSSILCAAATNVYFMILMRLVQGLGAGGMVSLSIGMIKDSFLGQTRATALAIVQSMSVIAPIAAPVLGAVIIQVSTWRVVFAVLAVISAACLAAGFLFEESIHEEERNDYGMLDSLKRIAVVGRNIDFSSFLVAASFFSAPFMAYLAVASYVYEDHFGLAPTTFSIFFAINAVTCVLGPLLYMKLNSRVTIRRTMAALILTGCAAAAAMLLVGSTAPVVFLLTMIPFSIANSYIRPFSTNVLLDQVQGDTGSASALLNFMHTMLGSLGMFIGSLSWSSYITGIGITMLGFMALTILTWLWVCRSARTRF